jgi:hypothetical protein
LIESPEQGVIHTGRIYIMSKEIGAEAALENCRALINQINAGLSAEKPLVNASTAAELLLHLDSAASALRKSAGRL